MEFVARSFFQILDYGHQTEAMQRLAEEVGLHL